MSASTQGSIDALPSSLAAEAAWNEANRAKKITSLRRAKAKAKVAEYEQRIKQANQNGRTLTGSTQSILGDLARKLANAMVREEEAEAQDKQASKELKIATKAWQPWADAEAASEDAPRIPRVAHLMEAARRSEAPKAAPAGKEPVVPQGRHDPTIGKPLTPKEQADAALAKPVAGLKAMREGAASAGVQVTQQAPPRVVAQDKDVKVTARPVQPRQVAKDRGIDLTGATGTALPKKDRTDFGTPPPPPPPVPVKGSKQLRAEARQAKAPKAK